MVIGATAQGVCLLAFVAADGSDVGIRSLEKHLGTERTMAENEHIQQAKRELEAYFAGVRTAFDVPLHTPGSAFQQQVWASLLTIPYGTTTSYEAQAEALHSPKAIRAMAAANGQNRIAIIVPCHRVIGKNGSLTGYAGGLDRKRWLINFEREHAGGAADFDLFSQGS
jgi:AraC family transcriptional regulator of adaptative response/methylated-DNA-[protein]-cysteine methyltransferase